MLTRLMVSILLITLCTGWIGVPTPDNLASAYQGFISFLRSPFVGWVADRLQPSLDKIDEQLACLSCRR